MHTASMRACSSDSITHGPAITNSSPPPMVTLPTWKLWGTGAAIIADERENEISPRRRGGAENALAKLLSCCFTSAAPRLRGESSLAHFFRPQEQHFVFLLFFKVPLASALVARAAERVKQRMRLH